MLNKLWAYFENIGKYVCDPIIENYQYSIKKGKLNQFFSTAFYQIKTSYYYVPFSLINIHKTVNMSM